MSNVSKKTSRIASILGVVFVALVLIAAYLILDKVIFGGRGADDQTVVDTGPGSSYEKPLGIDANDGKMLAEDFAKKYKGKWITFDGFLRATAKHTDGIYPYSTLYLDDTSIMMLSILALKQTFSDDLEGFSEVRDANPPVEVSVIAKVEKYDETFDSVILKYKTNIDGSTPSVKSR